MSPPSKEEILVIGEIIRLKVHQHESLVKNRRYHLRNYSCCFVGRELVQWLVINGEVSNSANAESCMRILQENGILHHVCDDHLFKNEYLFYRFRIDDGTFFVDTEYEPYHQAIMIHQRILKDQGNTIILAIDDDDDNDDDVQYYFYASALVSWMVENEVVRDRYAGVTLCQQFLDIMIIKPLLCDTSEFFDNKTKYGFIFDLKYTLPLCKCFNVGDDLSDGMTKIASSAKKRSLIKRLWKKGTFDDDIVEMEPVKKIDCNQNTDNSIPTLKSVVYREVSVAELTNKESPYYWKNIRITSDSVGFGFVIRGNGPCYVQAVDPTGPAASAGLKVRMYIYSVNGKDVLEKSHREVAQEMMQSIVIDLVVLQHFRKSN